ncbi:MAG: molybdate ABC transporter permease subunit [Clostridiales Family XIII bacterium]|jgi:molybdate transport system permease protein|nr:molybdate ABC transporter permease subunit [Clostridiales Family XIII bacterium]
MEFAPILISLKTACVAIVFTFVIGTWLAYAVCRAKNNILRTVLDAFLTLPLVLPPTVAGFFLLYIFGVYRPIGSLLARMGVKLVFSWQATVLAATVIALPLMYRSAKAAFTQVDPLLLQAARTLGLSETAIVFRILFPLASPGLMSGGILAFSRGLGEFGATAMIAGNIAGVTRTMPLAIYSSVSGGRMEEAYRYVIVLVLISFLFVCVLNFVSDARSKKYRPDDRRRT